jgi:hypothetical protein
LVVTAEEISDPAIENSHLVCKECGNKLPHETKSDWLNLDNVSWVPSFQGRTIRGFHINQMYSFVLTPAKIAESVLKARFSPSAEQELYNSKLGLPHAVDGARVTEKLIQEAIGGYTKGPVKSSLPVTMGVDVGASWLHVTIDQWRIKDSYGSYDINEQAECRTLHEVAVRDFEDLDTLMRVYNVGYALVDAQPERRSATRWVQKWHGRAHMVFYNSGGLTGRQFRIASEDEHLVLIDRTMWMDLALGRFKAHTITIPADTSIDYRNHIKAPVRVYKTNKKTGADYSVYVTGNDADHFAHSRTYSEAALKMLTTFNGSQSMGDIW